MILNPLHLGMKNTNDAIGRRTAMARSGSVFSATDTLSYLYNDRSEVTGANSNAAGSLYHYAYSFDNHIMLAKIHIVDQVIIGKMLEIKFGKMLVKLAPAKLEIRSRVSLCLKTHLGMLDTNLVMNGGSLKNMQRIIIFLVRMYLIGTMIRIISDPNCRLQIVAIVQKIKLYLS